MGLGVAIMIEGQEGLTWERWQRLARAAEDFGYESLFRSDHVTGLFGSSERPSLDTWTSITWLATATTRIRFGSLVCPLTFYHPALLAKRAAAVDVLVGASQRPSPDPWTSITWLATASTRIRFGSLVCPLTFYHPALLAKRAAAVDVLSGGRLDLGIGAGWHEGEHRMFGIPFPPVKERLDRLECGARAIRALWEGQ